jgi:hypothetical protein
VLGALASRLPAPPHVNPEGGFLRLRRGLRLRHKVSLHRRRSAQVVLVSLAFLVLLQHLRAPLGPVLAQPERGISAGAHGRAATPVPALAASCEWTRVQCWRRARGGWGGRGVEMAYSRFSRCISAYDDSAFFSEECFRSAGFCVLFTG